MVKVSGFGMYIADLQDVYGGWRALAATDEIIGNLRDLSAHFDMIVVIAPPSQNDPLGAVLASHVDGNIMVIEAEHTRRAAALRLRQTLAASGGLVLGAILNNQQVHTPNWLM
jgi:Mrp family chromosome partitioning ATPase